MQEQFVAWRRELKAAETGEPFNRVANQINSGFYRVKRGGKWVPVAIWRTGTDDPLVMRMDDMVVAEPDRQYEVFLRCNAVASEHCKHAFENGSWPGDWLADTPGAPSTARASLGAIIQEVRDWSEELSDREAGKTLADQAANADDKILQLEKAAKLERDGALKPLRDAVRVSDTEKKAADEAVKKARTLLASAKQALSDAVEDWSQMLGGVAPAREMCRSIYLPWQRAQSVAGRPTLCGGELGKRKAYVKKNDAGHPENVAARKAVIAAAELEAERRKIERSRAGSASVAAMFGHEEQRRQETQAQPCQEQRQSPHVAAIEITDWAAAVMHFVGAPLVRNAVERCALDAIRQGRELSFARPVAGPVAGEAAQ